MIRKTMGLSPITACDLDVIVSASARDDDGGGYDIDGCDMKALGSCY